MTDEAKTLAAQLDDLVRHTIERSFERCAAEVEAAGCSCVDLGGSEEMETWPPGDHYPRCPRALAQMLRDSCKEIVT